MDTQTPSITSTGFWYQLGSRMLQLADELGHQLSLPDRFQDSLCAKLDRRLEGAQPTRQAG